MTKRLISFLTVDSNRRSGRLIMIYTILQILVLINLSNSMKLPLDNFNVPCSYLDTVDLTNATRFANGSYLYVDILIPSTYVGIYDYELTNSTHRRTVKPHARGCVCELTPKKCIRWCCPEGEVYQEDAGCAQVNMTYLNEVNVVMADGENVTVDAYSYFVPQEKFRPCDEMYPLSMETDDDSFRLHENGDVFLLYDGSLVDKNNMCFSYTERSDNISDAFLTVYLCLQQNVNTVRILFNAYAMLFSIPFMIITIMVYTFIPELRNLHGKSLSCYLIGLVFGYSLMCSQIFHKELDPFLCKMVGFVQYFSFMSAFFWLSVISFDLWWNFRGTRGRNLRDSKRFYIFSLYAWGLALLCTGLTVAAQLTDYIPEKYKPGIGGGDYCWLDVVQNYSAVTYFYGPVLAIITFNVIMFVITSLKIHHVQREVARMIAREDSRKNLRSEKDQYGLFLRLFIVMGVTWSMEIISYIIGENHIFAWLFYAIDLCNAIQGFLIFALFVLKKKVKHLIFKRFKQIRGINRSSQYSTKTISSNITMTAISHDKPLLEAKPLKDQN